MEDQPHISSKPSMLIDEYFGPLIVLLLVKYWMGHSIGKTKGRHLDSMFAVLTIKKIA
jgi:hypothetical protein